MKLPKEIEDNYNTVTANPDTMRQICVHVAEGGAIHDLCKVWGIPYGYVLEWVNSDPERAKQYKGAIVAQMHWGIERVMKELQLMATLDFSRAYDDKGRLLHPKEMPEEIRRAIAGIEVTEEFEGVGADRELIGYTKKVKFWDKPKALELMGRKFAMFVDRVKVDAETKSLEDLIDESWNAKIVDAEIIVPIPQPEPDPPTPGKAGGLESEEGSTSANFPPVDLSG